MIRNLLFPRFICHVIYESRLYCNIDTIVYKQDLIVYIHNVRNSKLYKQGVVELIKALVIVVL